MANLGENANWRLAISTAGDVLFSTTEDVVNLCFIVAQKYIYFCKTLRKTPVIEEYLAKIRHVNHIEEQIAVKRNKIRVHRIKWRAQ